MVIRIVVVSNIGFGVKHLLLVYGWYSLQFILLSFTPVSSNSPTYTLSLPSQPFSSLFPTNPRVNSLQTISSCIILSPHTLLLSPHLAVCCLCRRLVIHWKDRYFALTIITITYFRGVTDFAIKRGCYLTGEYPFIVKTTVAFVEDCACRCRVVADGFSTKTSFSFFGVEIE